MVSTAGKEAVKKDKFGFPSPFVPQSVKNQPEYIIKYAESMDAEYNGGGGNNQWRNMADTFFTWRSYGNANQSIEKYKPSLGIRKKTRRDPNAVSYKALNWEILPIAPKFVNALIGKLMKQNNSIGVKAIDKNAQDERRVKRVNLQEYVTNKKFLEGISAQTGIQFQTPEMDDAPLPEDKGSIDLYMDMFYKERYCLVLQDMLMLINHEDNYEQLLADIAKDLVHLGRAATKTYRVGRQIRRRRCIPERMIIGGTKYDDFRDIRHVGEYWDLSIGELKEIAGNQFTEEQYKQIAEQATGKRFADQDISKYYTENYSYPWDPTKITVLDFVFFSPDVETESIKINKYGNVNVFKQDYEWWRDLEKKGVTVDSFNKKNGPDHTVVQTHKNNTYEGMWIVGTKFVFNHGKSKDMLKSTSQVGKNIGHFCIHSLGDSPIRQAIPIFDNIQLNWLQYQHHIAKSRPAGLDIEYSALSDISLGGAGGKKMTPKQVLELYFDTGILLWRRRNSVGDQNWRPINELNNGISAAAAQHFNNIVSEINLLREVLGLNELTDGSTPNSEIGKQVANLAVGASEDTLRPMHFAFDQLNLGTQKRTVMHLANMAKVGLSPHYTEAFGEENVAFMSLMSDIGAHDYGIYLMREPTTEMRAKLGGYITEEIRAKTLTTEEAWEIENEPNIYRAIQLLKSYRKRKRMEAQEDQRLVINAEKEKNIASTQATHLAKVTELREETNAKSSQAWEVAKAQVWAEKQTLPAKAFLLNMEYKLKNNLQITAEEEKRMTEMMKIDKKGKWDKEIQASAPKPAAPGKK